MRILAAAAAAALLVLAPGHRLARADVDIPKADALFAEGQALKATDPAAACAKFQASLSFNPQALGTLLNVALCDEHAGRIASAVAKFTEARDRAQEQSLPDYVQAADDHLAALRPELPFVAIRFAVPPGPETKLLVDDRVIALDGSVDLSAVAVDPGERTFAVSQPGRVTYVTSLVIAKRQRQVLEIPALRSAVTVKSYRGTAGKITLGVGLAALASGVVMGYLAKRDYDELFLYPRDEDLATPELCFHDPGGDTCNRDGQARAREARRLGNIGTVVGALGIAAVATGAVLWFTAPSTKRAESRERSVHVVPAVTPESAGLTAVGRF